MAFLLLLVDGYDAQSIAFVAPALGKDLHLGRAALGPVFSSGLLGLMLGAVVFSPLADRFGTRPVLAICTLIYAIFTLATIWVASFQGLFALRLLTGFGLGGVMPNSVGVVLEYVPTRFRTTMVTVAVCGYPLGGAVGGVVSAAMIEKFGWHSVFLVGAIVPLITLPLVLWSFPNSLFPRFECASATNGTASNGRQDCRRGGNHRKPPLRATNPLLRPAFRCVCSLKVAMQAGLS